MRRLIENLTIVPQSGTGPADFDTEGLIHRLLLFDQVILLSWRLAEFGVLVRRFGVAGTSALLRSGALGIHCTGASVGYIRTPDAPLLSYSFGRHKPGESS